MRALFSRLRKDEKGQSLVEFALVAVPLIMLLLGIVEFGWLFNGQITVTSAAREGARVAAVSGTLSQVEAAVQSHLANSGVTLEEATVDSNGESVTVSVNGFLEPLVGFYLKSTVRLAAKAVMRLE